MLIDVNDHFWKEIAVDNVEFNQHEPTFTFKYRMNHFGVMLVSCGIVEWAFTNVHRLDGKVDTIIRSITMDSKSVSRVWFRAPKGPTMIRVMAWPKAIA